jgi:hypothetical protein
VVNLARSYSIELNRKVFVAAIQLISYGMMQSDVRSAFKSWAAHHGKAYGEGTSEFEQRLVHWKNNVAALLEGNQERPAVSVNSLMDMHDEEFKQSYLGQSKLSVDKEPG